MSTTIGMNEQKKINQGLIAKIIRIITTSSFSNNNVVEIKTDPNHNKPLSRLIVKLPGMSPRDFARYRRKCGHSRKRKNFRHCARLAKVKRRRV